MRYWPMIMLRALFLLLCSTWGLTVSAQYGWQDASEAKPIRLTEGVAYSVEAMAGASKGVTPLWLNANRYGLSSLEEVNGYLRCGLIRPLQTDSARRWALGYGADVVVPVNYTSKVVVQQAFAELRWLHGVLTVGSKEMPMELKNNRLSSGAQALGINARPVPQVRLALPEYWVLPIGNDWLRIKGHVAYGMMTDDNWQHDFTNRQSKYADRVLYHSKAGYLMIGNPDRFYPLSVELGLEMAATFGGTLHFTEGKGPLKTVKSGMGLRDFWHVFVPGGADVGETMYQNIAGNQLGSWLARVNYETDGWKLSLYADKFFEDHSAMFQLDYDGYGQGEEWGVKKRRRYFLYDFKDMMLGLELHLKRGWWLQNVVLEYLHTDYQSGPIYHDHTKTLSDHISGDDNYYNHYLYTGWQHWGQVMGNPLYRSPIYNKDGSIGVQSSRFRAIHLGVSGRPVETVDYRLLATVQQGWGTYAYPFTEMKRNVSVMGEVSMRLGSGWQLKGACGFDEGDLLGHNYGLQFSVSKAGLF